MGVYRLQAADFAQMSREAITSRTRRWAETLAIVDLERVRFVFRSVPLRLTEPLARARRAEAEATDDQQAAHLRSYAGLLAQASSGVLFNVDHYLVLPGLENDVADAKASAFCSGLAVGGMRLPDLPSLLPTRYVERPEWLEPAMGNHPLMSVLVSYDLSGTWDWTVLTGFLTLGLPIDVAVDLRTHVGPAAFGVLDRRQVTIEGLQMQLGAKSALAKQAADYASLLRDVQEGQAIHEVAVAVLARGRSRKALDETITKIKARGAGRILFDRYSGLQARHYKAFFTGLKEPAPPTQLRRNVSSLGAATALGPLGLRRRAQTRGLMWGYSQQEPFFWDGFGARLNQANHWVVLGTTNSGKTTSLFGLLWREMDLLGTQGIILDPIGNCRSLIGAIGEQRTSYNPLSLRSLRINPVELIYEDMPTQMAHLTVILQMLLGRPLSIPELTALDLVLPTLYGSINVGTHPRNQPQLEQLSRLLRSSRRLQGDIGTAGRRLGDLLYHRYVQGSLQSVFCTDTRADWRLEKDLVAFDFRGVPDEANLRRLAYYLVLSVIEREAYRQKRARRRWVVVDEFARLSTDSNLAARVAMMFKTFRTLGVGVMALEQDLVTFIGSREMAANQTEQARSGRQILNNATGVLALAHQPAGAQVLPLFFPQLTDEHVRHLMGLNPQGNAADRGRGLVILADQVYPLKISLTRHELNVLGST